MSLRAILYAVATTVVITSSSAQRSPIFDPDDFVDPAERVGTLFISRVVIGGATGLVDDYRPLHQNAAFLLVANSLYWSGFQIDYKHSEVKAKVNGPANVSVCGCSSTSPIYFPTPPLPDSTPDPPLPAPKETTQFAFYRTVGGSTRQPALALRYRLSWSRQKVDTVVAPLATGQAPSRMSGHEQSFGLDADTYFRVGSHDVWGTLLYARSVRSGTTDNRSQTELGYLSRFPDKSLGAISLHTTLTVGGVSGRGASGLNVINPAFEAFWHNGKTDVNVHLIWSPMVARSGTAGWESHSQIALFIDRALIARLFRPHDADAAQR